MAKAKSIIGASVPRVEGAEKVSGRALYTADVKLPGMLWGKVLRSPHPHARIVRIDTSRAAEVEGVRAVVTGEDARGLLSGQSIRDIPVLCWDKARFVGDGVAAVAAETLDAAEEALGRIEVEYDVLPAVFDPLAAMEPDAPRLHDNVAGYEGPPQELLIPDVPNGLTRLTWSKGDVEQGFREADLVVEHTFRIPIRHQGYIETRAAVVAIGGDGRIQVWLSTKTPLATRNQVAKAIGVPEERIRLNAVNVGGDFGGKCGPMDAPIAYLLAQKAARPVKIMMSYSEELTAGNPSHPSVITVRTGVKRDGRMVARYLRAVHSTGAYGGHKPIRASIGGAGTAGPYRIDHVFIEAIHVYTNTLPGGFWRAPGALQAMFAVESHIDLVARELGMDPAEFRLKNIIGEGEENALGVRLQGVKARATLQAALDAAGWKRPKSGPNYGRGVAMYERFTGAGPGWVILTAEIDGSFTLLTVNGDQGTGLRTVLSQTVAEEMSVPIGQVRVVVGDTDTAPFNIDIGFGGSRSTNIGGRAVIQACSELRQKLVVQAAQALDCPKDQVVYQAGRFWNRDGRRRELSLHEVVAKAGSGPISVTAKIETTIERSSTSFVAQVAEDPIGHQGQIDGGAVMAIGAALMEEITLENGQVTTPHLGDYKLPSIADIPRLKTVLVRSDSGPGPYETKAIGEMANVSPPAAIANAVADAVGVRLFDLPITSEKVYNGLRGSLKGGIHASTSSA
ncbi:MAG: xanthine dehydrogenase family protein molybdopterin-binding subunit [Deltaproteobacteria bacterium]|nr:xanthine dehydrogenase family protein molybdopterin-binding subunit [Deltaproteobacteria bacterium]